MDRSLTLVNGGVEEETKKVDIDKYIYVGIQKNR